MADNFIWFSEAIELDPEEVAWWKEKIAVLRDLNNPFGVAEIDSMSDDERDALYNSGKFDLVEKPANNEAPYVWIHDDDGCGDPLGVALIVQHFLKAVKSDFAFSLTWAETCSKPRLGEFGGGAVVVTADSLDVFSATEMASMFVKKKTDEKQNRNVNGKGGAQDL